MSSSKPHQHAEARPSIGVQADFWVALALLALGIAALLGGWSMDRLEIRRIHPASIPGLVPMLLGAALIICSSLLLLEAIRQKGYRLTRLGFEADGFIRLGLCLILTLGYPLLLIGHMPYWLATSIFVFLFITFLEWQPARALPGHIRALGTALLQAVIVGVVVALLFEKFFLVRLP